MQVLKNLFGPQSENYERSLSRLSLRQNVLTGNLANINTPGYRRRDVDFAIELKQAERGLTLPSEDEGSVTMESGAVRIDENGVDLEHEVYELGDNELRFQATTHMARSYFRGLKNVIREGR